MELLLSKPKNKYMAKFDHYYPRYKRHFSELADGSLRLLEIGVQDGSSIAYWKSEYPKWDVWGMDIDPHCAGHQIVIGDQTNVSLLESFEPFDIIIDDGGHTMNQQVVSFETLFPKMKSGGVYVIEDLHTSFWPKFFDSEMRFLDYAKSLTETIHNLANDPARLEGYRLPENPLGIESIHFYPSIIFIHKK